MEQRFPEAVKWKNDSWHVQLIIHPSARKILQPERRIKFTTTKTTLNIPLTGV
jgi:hypothetical protein